MLADSLNITYNAVSIALSRVREQNFESTYYAENGGRKFTLDVKHTVPARGASGESHLVKLAVEQFDANGLYTRTESPWFVIKTFDSTQNSTTAAHAANALVGLLSPTFIGQIIGRQS